MLYRQRSQFKEAESPKNEAENIFRERILQKIKAEYQKKVTKTVFLFCINFILNNKNKFNHI